MSRRVGLMTGLALVAAVGLLAAGATVVSAEEMEQAGAKWTWSLTKDYTPSPWTSEMGYKNRAVGKLGFGLKNLLLGWTDLFVETKETTDGGGNFFKGLGIGVKDTVENTLGGVVHLVTFPITGLDAPLPEGGTQVMS